MNRLLVLAMLAATCVALAAGRASAATGYADLPGDAGTAPDIGAVAVSNTPDGQLTFQISMPSTPELPADVSILLALDTDMNQSTGLVDAGGIDYALLLDGETHSFALGRWDGSTFAPAPATTAQVGYASGAYISINRSELGGTGDLEFWARTIQGTDPAAGHVDEAPDGFMWEYLLSVGQSGYYVDAAGDSGTASDVGAVSVSNNEAGQLAFEIVTNHPRLAADEIVAMALDTDQNPATGDTEALGAEYLYVLDGETQSYGLGVWNGSDFDFAAPHSTVRTSYANGVGFTINRSELGNTSGFNFAVLTGQVPEPGPGRADLAPDAGIWSYQLAAAAPAAPPEKTVAATPLKLAVARVFTKPAAPVPGTIFTVFAEVRRSDTGADLTSGTVKCAGTVAFRKIPVAQATFVKGTPACAFRVPPGSQGKMLRGSISVTAEGVTAKRIFSYRVGAPKRKTAAAGSRWRLAAAARVGSGDLRGHAIARGLSIASMTPPWIPWWIGGAF